MIHLPQLSKTTKTGATQVCNISYLGDSFTVEWGQLDGALQTKSTRCHTTNEGKLNQRDPTQQAAFEAKAKWDSKVKSGYSDSIDEPSNVLLPMKVKVWEPKRFEPGLISTPKLNGVNGIYKLEDGELNLYSRGGNLYPSIPHHKDIIIMIMKVLKSTELNGELYIDNTHLQDITSAVKKPKELSKSLQFVIFDIADSNEPYSVRRNRMLTAEASLDSDFVMFLNGVECSCIKDIETHYNQCMALNLEGTVIKHPDALYEHNVRSNQMWKYKKMLDCEKQITGYTIDKNGHCVFTVSVSVGSSDTFKVKMKGTNSERIAVAAEADTYIGRWLNISYETLSRDGKCLKPVGNYFRECDKFGQPKE